MLRSAFGVILVILVPGAIAPKVLTRKELKLLPKGSVIVDVSIDKGSWIETSRPTTHKNPTYLVDEIVNYCIANLPGTVPCAASYFLNMATFLFGLNLANNGLDALKQDDNLLQGLHTHKGKLVYQAIAKAQGLEYCDPQVALNN